MIITVTLNPSIDISYPLEHFNLDTINRTDNVSKTAGGKGLNVTRVIHDLNGDVTATGILGGNFGHFIMEQLDTNNINHQFAEIQNETRFCIAVLHDNNQTEILEAGPEVSQSEIDNFLKTYQELLNENSTITISGSMAKGFPIETYSEMIKIANQNHCKVLLDTSGKTLAYTLQAEHKPYLIKPNFDEIGELLGKKIDTNNLSSVIDDLKQPLFEDIELIVISMGANGAFVKNQDSFYKVNIPEIDVVNPVGSGDSTIAGMAYAIDQDLSVEEIIKYGMTCGVLNTMNPKTGCIDIENFENIYSQITFEKF